MKKIISIFIILIFSSCGNNSLTRFEKGKKELKSGNYQMAIYYFKRVPLKNAYRDSAKIMIKYCDSIITIQQKRKIFLEDSLRKVAFSKDMNKKVKECEDYIKTLRKFNIKKREFRGSIPSILEEIQFFNKISNKIDSYSYFDNIKLKDLSKKLKKTLTLRQIYEFPSLRKEYTKIINEKLWEDNIKVTSENKKNKTLVFIGGIFASNKNKQIFQNKIYEIVKKLRFDKIKYKWYQYDSDYKTYYIPSKKDSDISFN